MIKKKNNTDKRNVDQWKEMEDSEDSRMSTYNYSHLIFDKKPKTYTRE